MRPDLDDFEEMNEGDAPRSRAMSWLVLVVAVGGFAALAYYAYHSGSQSVRDGQVMVVEADQNPIKAAPADPEGEQFPNKDKTIYDTIDPEEAAADQKVEKLLPDAEEPVIPEPAVTADENDDDGDADSKADSSTTTFVNKANNSSEPIDPVDAQSMKQGAPPIAPEAKPQPAAAPVVESKPAPAPAPAPVTAVEKPAGSPEFVNVKPAKPAPAPAAKPAAKPVAKPTAKPAAKPATAASGNYQIQLGAFKSDAEARAQWGKIAAKNRDVLTGSPIVVKAALPNGTFYRLRATGFASPDAAKAACTKLSSRGQACFYAGK